MYQDLQPYICTFVNCDRGFQAFPSRTQWSSHELSQHRILKWSCDICNLTMTTEGNLRAHISGEHSEIGESELKALRDEHEKAWMLAQECPFCLSKPANDKRSFLSHVGRHLEEVSLAAIPSLFSKMTSKTRRVSKTILQIKRQTVAVKIVIMDLMIYRAYHGNR